MLISNMQLFKKREWKKGVCLYSIHLEEHHFIYFSLHLIDDFFFTVRSFLLFSC